MIQDLNKSISNISYNFLNLPETVTMSGQNCEYIYDAIGNKIRYDMPGSGFVDYVGNLEFVNGSDPDILTSEGRITGYGGNYSYEYYITDHLGNTRGVIDQSSNILQVSNYYPFGMRHEPITLDYPTQKYLYQGKEMHPEMDIYDFGSRFYDPALGRWGVVDPQAVSFAGLSPYGAMGNNPVAYIDPAGEFIEWGIIDGFALLGGYIGGATAEGGELNPGKWDWDGDTWAGVGIGAGLGALGGYGVTMAAPGLASALGPSGLGFSNVSAATTAYGLTGAAAGGAVGYGSGFAGGLLHSDGDWQYAHQSGMWGLAVGSTVGGTLGTAAGFLSEYEFPKWEETLSYKLPETWGSENGDLPIVNQANPQAGCAESTLESMSYYKGQCFSVPVSGNGADFRLLAEEWGYNAYRIPNNAHYAGNKMLKGNPIAITYNNGSLDHTVGINEITIYQKERIFGKGYRTKTEIQVMDPLYENKYRRFSNHIFNAPDSYLRVLGFYHGFYRAF